MMNATETYKKWNDRLSNNTQAVKDGIDRVTENPMAKAAAKEDKWFAGVQKAKSSGRWKRGLMGVSLEQWKTKARDIGADRIPAGAAAAEQKMTGFYNKLLPFEEKLRTQVRAMPDVTIQDSIARSTAWITGMSQFDSTK
jgi:hypothetical protein